MPIESHLKIATWIAELLDSKYKIGKFRFGLDSFLDALYLPGDIIGIILASYIVWVAGRCGAPAEVQQKMVRNMVVDFVIGLVPLAGSIGTAFFKSNLMNIALLNKWLESAPLEGQVVHSRRLSFM